MADITYADVGGSKKAIYRVNLPAHPRDWTVDTLRKFVRDADELSIPGETHVKRDLSQPDYSFGTEGNFNGLCVECIVEL